MYFSFYCKCGVSKYNSANDDSGLLNYENRLFIMQINMGEIRLLFRSIAYSNIYFQVACLLSVLLLTLTACGAKPPPEILAKDIAKLEHVVDYTLPLVQRAYAIPHETVCEREGGTWKKLGMQQHESCVLPASDAGKACKDSAECEVACVAQNSDAELGARAEGVCLHSTDLFGCHIYLSDGITESAFCED